MTPTSALSQLYEAGDPSSEASIVPLQRLSTGIADRYRELRWRQADLAGTGLRSDRSLNRLTLQAAFGKLHRLTIADLTETIFPYLTTVEGLKLAALSFGKDVAKLSCCAG